MFRYTIDHSVYLCQWSSTESNVPSPPGDIWQRPEIFLIVTMREMLLTCHGQRPGILQIILQCTEQPSTFIAKKPDQTKPKKKTVQPKISIVTLLRNFDLCHPTNLICHARIDIGPV